MFSTPDLDAMVQSERGAGRARSDRTLRPVRTLDEEHALRFATEGPIPVDPEQAAGFVADRDDQPGVEGMTDQQAVDGRERECHRMRAAVLVQVILVESDRGTEMIRVQLEQEGPLPRLLHEPTHTADRGTGSDHGIVRRCEPLSLRTIGWARDGPWTGHGTSDQRWSSGAILVAVADLSLPSAGIIRQSADVAPLTSSGRR